MTTEASDGSSRRRGRAKLFPVVDFKDAFGIAEGIKEHGAGTRMRRMTLFDHMDRSPNSSLTRTLVVSSGRYGLTNGGYKSEYLEVTDDAKMLLDEDTSTADSKKKIFELSINRFAPFADLYTKRKDSRLPAADVLMDEVGDAGVPTNDRELATEIFLANCEHIGLVREISGSKSLISIEQVIEEIQDGVGGDQGASAESLDQGEGHEDPPREEGHEDPPRMEANVSEPSVHIDIQIHIDSTASAEQIDQVFSSMARHLYRRDE